MNKLLLIAALTAFSTAQAENLWYYGVDGSATKGRDNANEFESSTGFIGSFTFNKTYTGSAVRMDAPGSGIGYLDDNESFVQVCTRLGYGCANAPRDYYAAASLIFSFTNNSTKSCTDIVLNYHRHGSEVDQITYQNGSSQTSFNVGGAAMEASQTEFTTNLQGTIEPGDTFNISIDYIGGGTADNGHFIDYIALDASCTAGCTIDSDNDRLPDCYETNTGVYLSATDTGTDPNNDDTDGDGIKDGDEVLGTVAGLDLPAMGLSPLKKNILLEYDWFDDSNGCAAHSHRPTPAQISLFSNSFANAPVANPDGSTGIKVINDYGQGGAFTGGNHIPDSDGVIDDGVGGAEFLNYKAANFDSNRNGYFHYVLMPHQYGTNSLSSGQAEIAGDDLIVSLQCYLSTTNVANTISHELGHNLNLRHGGDSNCNYKPNYNSIMNYRYQFPGVDTNCDVAPDGVLDYSSGTNIALNELDLNENNGVCGAGTTPIDWNNNALIETSVTQNINPDGNISCGASFSTLTDWNDWANIVFSGILDGDGNRLSPPEITSCINTPTS